MSLKSWILPRLAHYMLSPQRRARQHKRFERKRVRSGQQHEVLFFHDPADPYSQLLQQVLPAFEDRYDVTVRTHLVAPPDADAAPLPDLLKTHAFSDSGLLAAKAGLNFTPEHAQPAQDTATGDRLRAKFRHYLGGMLFYGGEWYWGLDRLHFLETRLQSVGAGPEQAPIYAQPACPQIPGPVKTGQVKTLHFYLSFRSPYTAIVIQRVKALADTYGAELKLRFVLPMVMRNLPVNPDKKQYILNDTAREAARLGVAFGKASDPVGKPVERGYALLPWAIDQGLGYAFVESFIKHVWTGGVNAGTDRGMAKIVTAAGLSWAEAKTVITNEDWRAEAELNRTEMMDYGIWGVPSFRLDDTICWGQDRLWVIEDVLRRSGT